MLRNDNSLGFERKVTFLTISLGEKSQGLSPWEVMLIPVLAIEQLERRHRESQ
jgi:hypothetical protein